MTPSPHFICRTTPHPKNNDCTRRKSGNAPEMPAKYDNRKLGRKRKSEPLRNRVHSLVIAFLKFAE
jgi:hypothetical protein